MRGAEERREQGREDAEYGDQRHDRHRPLPAAVCKQRRTRHHQEKDGHVSGAS